MSGRHLAARSREARSGTFCHYATPKTRELDPSVPYIAYPESMAWYGALAFAQASDDKELTCGGWSFELFRNDF